MILEVIIYILLGIGIFFILAGVVGMFKFKDIYCRLQASTNIVTLGVMPILLGVSVYGFYIGNFSIGIKSILMIAFILLTNPMASQALIRAAEKENLPLHKFSVYDRYKEDEENE